MESDEVRGLLNVSVERRYNPWNSGAFLWTGFLGRFHPAFSAENSMNLSTFRFVPKFKLPL